MATAGNTLFLLGAGASVDAGLPTSTGLTDCFVKHLTLEPVPSVAVSTAATLLRDKLSELSGNMAINFEQFLSTALALANRNQLEISPFVACWSPEVESFVADHPSGFKDLVDTIRQLLPRFLTPGTQVVGNEPRHGETNEFANDQKQIAYLEPLLKFAHKSSSAIVTLNYDCLVEKCGAGFGIPICTGMKAWLASGQLGYECTALPVIKLHGSIDWLKVEHSNPLPWTDVGDGNEFTSVPGLEFADIILGTEAKLKPYGPYPDLFSEFRRRLFNATNLVVVGYSFGDEHVNQTIGRWFAQAADRKIIIVDRCNEKSAPSFEHPTSPFISGLMKLLKACSPRLTYIGTGAKSGIPRAIEALSFYCPASRRLSP